MGRYPFSFRVHNRNEANNTYYEQCGMGICRSYADAITIIEEQYGSELMSIKHLELYDEGQIIAMPYEVMKKIITEYFEGNEVYEVQLSEQEAKEI